MQTRLHSYQDDYKKEREKEKGKEGRKERRREEGKKKREEERKKKNTGEDVEIFDPLCIASGNAKQYSCWGNSSAARQRINLELTYDPAIPLLGIYLK